MERLERKRQPEALPRPMTLEQLESFFRNIDSIRDRALFSLLYGSGLRVSEALGLDREHVDLESRVFRVLGKGSRERVGYLSDQTAKLLRKYLRQRGGPKTGALFVSRQGRLSYAMAHHLFRGYAADLPGDMPTIHSLRHSFGSERAGNIDALVLRDLMGHKSLRTTQQYSKVNPEAAQRAFEAFDRSRKLVK
jgi:integrase/recombinase XerC